MKKSGSKKIAERYVKALFDVATAAGAAAAVEKDLQTLAAALNESAEFSKFLHNPLLSRKQKAEVAAALLARLGANKVTTQFISLLAAQNRLDLLAEMAKLFIEKCALSRGEISAELVVASKVSAADSEAIASALGKAYNKKINLSIREDKAIVGGSIINIGSLRLDGSLAGKLDRLKQKLKAA